MSNHAFASEYVEKLSQFFASPGFAGGDGAAVVSGAAVVVGTAVAGGVVVAGAVVAGGVVVVGGVVVAGALVVGTVVVGGVGDWSEYSKYVPVLRVHQLEFEDVADEQVSIISSSASYSSGSTVRL